VFTENDLIKIMRDCAGADDTIRVDGDVLDEPFAELGFDSLAVLEIQSRIALDHNISMPDEAIEQMTTPRRTVGYVTELLSAQV
jgi:act minimal PKS acyl carrier protein